MSENEVATAVASQEEHIKRIRSCQGVIGQAHRFDRFGAPDRVALWSECFTCGVTETRADYAVKTGWRM